MTATEKFDVVIVGSGPGGSTFARALTDLLPAARALLVDAGPLVSAPAGGHVNNITDGAARAKAQLASQGPAGYPFALAPEEEGDLAHSGPHQVHAHPGLFLLSAAQDECADFPAGAMADAVGGMGCHWFGCCPRPWGTEQIDFIEPEARRRSFQAAERLWRVSSSQFSGSGAAQRLEGFLGGLFDQGRPPDRRVQPMPLALDPTLPGTGQCGPAVVLGPLLSGAAPGFELRPQTLCRRLLTKAGRVYGAELVDLRRGARYRVGAEAIVVAADALRTPQLLFASGIRPAALGRHLNEHPYLSVTVELRASSPLAELDPPGARPSPGEHLAGIMPPSGVTWIPFAGASFPFHAQLAQRGRHLSFGFFLPKDLDPANRLEFSPTVTDWRGLPAVRAHYSLTAQDQARARRARDLMVDMAAEASAVPAEPRLMPTGSSLHYQGTVRMGAADDGTSVCDRFSRVWGIENLFVAGNGVIPTSTACNPTLTATALAVVGAGELARQLTAGGA